MGSQDIFVSRYENDGNCLWSKHIGSPKTDYINAIDSDVDGNLITAPAWPAHPEWIAKFLQVLGTKIEL